MAVDPEKKKSFVPMTEDELPSKKMGRPVKEIDLTLMRKLAKLHLSNKTIADCLRIHVDTLRDRYSNDLELWRSESDGKLAEIIYDEAINRRKEYAIKMIAQKTLGYFSKIEIRGPAAAPNDELDNMSKEELTTVINDLLSINE